jgi:phage related protein|nr:MAG TPA: Head Tail Connector Protein [Caudoviricetes sp.]
MDEKILLDLTKYRLGISTNVRDAYISAIIKATIKELEDEKGVKLEVKNDNHLLFISDYCAWRYLSRDKDGAIPRDLQYRLHNLIVHNGK